MKIQKKVWNKNKISKSLMGDIISYIVIFLLVWSFFHFVLLLGRIPSESMYPTIKVNDMTISNRLAFKKRTPQRGDIIIFNKDNNTICKRVIGIPGDTISFHNGYVYLNNEQLTEDYITDDIETNSCEVFTVPTNSYFVLGDNRENSNDSRFWDNPYVSSDTIIAKVIFIVPTHTLTDLILKNN